MLIPIAKIYIDPSRAREDYGDMNELVGLLEEHGQFLPITVQTKSDDASFEWELDDGGRRLRALTIISAKAALMPEYKQKIEAVGITPFHVEALLKSELKGYKKKVREYIANGGRANFNWKESAKLVREVHEGYTKDDPDWSVDKTAALFSISKTTAYAYLEITQDAEVFNSAQVQNADTYRTAKKQTDIVRDIKRRTIIANMPSIETTKTEETDYAGLARSLVYKGDCREWIRNIPDNSLSWFHWDPPYGTREGSGGAYPSFDGVQIDPSYCFKLMREMLPEIHRVLRDGSWFVMWCSHRAKHIVADMLRGHSWAPVTSELAGYCEHCGIERDDLSRLEDDYTCTGNPTAFWVNPFENQWVKTNFGNDGHEIKRFLRKDTEPFFFAGKGTDPILPVTNRGNLFYHDLPSPRRHVNHKPEGLLREILSVVSVPGEIGADASVGSASIIEATFGSGRRGIFAELAEDNWSSAVTITSDILKTKGIKNLSFDPRVVQG